MAEMSVVWLRVAAGFYSLGLLDAIVTMLRRREGLFRIALGALCVGGIFHLVSLIEQGTAMGHFPANGFYESASLCAFMLTVLFLFVYWRYRLGSLGVFIFPLIFVMTVVASLGRPVAAWSSQTVRNAWLAAHVALILVGYAALLFTAVAAVLYLLQERELKQKKPRSLYHRLPALGTLDDLISKSIALGFLFITVGIVAGSTWGFVEWGTRWIADPKIGISFVTWGVCLAMVFLRFSAGWRGRKYAIISVTALGFSVVTWAAHARLQDWIK